MDVQTQASSKGGLNAREIAPNQAVPGSLDALALLSSDQLLELFKAGGAGRLSELNGHPLGRMLAVPGLDSGAPAAVLRSLAKSPLFVWEGKSFAAAEGSQTGRGMNRVRAAGRRSAFTFRTYVANSLFDGAPCLAIDYDLPENPRLARGTYDELRALGNGLYLGRGLYKISAKSARLLLWFGVDTRTQDEQLRFTP